MKRLDSLSLDELNVLKQEKQKEIDDLSALKQAKQEDLKLIEDAEHELIQNTLKCVACMDMPKNVSFVDGCNHMALCADCEAKTENKACPLCQTPYTKTKRINL